MTTPRLSRRAFLARSATALALPMITPKQRLLGQAAPSNQINLALIGCGARAGYTFLANEPIPGLRIVAAVDPFRERRETFAAKLNEKYGTDACKPVRDFREIINRPDVDAVGVFTPDHWHVPIAWAAAQHRKDMYVEKPLTLALDWAWKLRPRDARKQRGLPVRHVPEVRAPVSSRLRSRSQWLHRQRLPRGRLVPGTACRDTRAKA